MTSAILTGVFQLAARAGNMTSLTHVSTGHMTFKWYMYSSCHIKLYILPSAVSVLGKSIKAMCNNDFVITEGGANCMRKEIVITEAGTIYRMK